MLILERPWTRQPQTASIDLSNPLATGLVFDFDVVSARNRLGKFATNYGSTISASSVGLARSFTRASSQYVDCGDLESWDVGGSNFTFQFLFRMRSAASSATRFQLLSKDSATGRQLWVELNIKADNSSDNSFTVVWLNGTLNQSRTPANSLNVGTWHNCFGQRLGNSVNYWIDGIAQSVTHIAANWVDVASTTTPLLLGARSYAANNDYFNGDISIARFWNRALRSDEVSALSANPWQLFQPRRIYIPTATAAASAPTITALSAIGITATSAQPRITYA